MFMIKSKKYKKFKKSIDNDLNMSYNKDAQIRISKYINYMGMQKHTLQL